MKVNKIVLIAGLVLSSVLSSVASAERYWPPVLTSWALMLNNGIAYISSNQFADHCDYSRGEIIMDGTEFNKAQYAYALSAKARGKSLAYVVDRSQSRCIITGLNEAS